MICGRFYKKTCVCLQCNLFDDCVNQLTNAKTDYVMNTNGAVNYSQGISKLRPAGQIRSAKSYPRPVKTLYQ